ncbi:MAG: Asp-tRNA(Asn)/Glu-tRNA(Gln) amidotransferase GatCAB subunit B, partial [Gemmatimonadetes bacterium]|nr:Asp-tRNA(Asn)/Glu-tRNA(Gln) amidotransferase GatCAB subunit B [Gemmatimonadota bacterium]
GLRQLSDLKTIEPLVSKVVAENPDKAAQYRAGRTGLWGFFVGQVMKQSAGRANPELVKKVVAEKLSER